MRTKEEYYELVLQNRKLASDPEVLKCTCPHTLCEWHGRCRECIALHRYHKIMYLPVCNRSSTKSKKLVKIGELWQ